MASNKSNEGSGWLGWVGFASIMLFLAGAMHLLAGFVALFKDTVYVTANHGVWVLSYTGWGWVHMLGGLLAILAAGSLANGYMYGRIFAVLVAMASAVANMAFVPIYPIWSVTIIVIDLLIIWAVIVHAGELKS